MNTRQTPPNQNQNPAAAQGAPQEEAMLRVDGYRQVLEMLRIADPEFRESLLRRLGARDPELGRALRAELGLR